MKFYININEKLFDAALTMCANDDDKDYKETIKMYRDFKDKNYKDNKSTKDLQQKFIVENWIKLRGKCPNLMHNYFLLVDLWLHPKYSEFIEKITKQITLIVLDPKDEKQREKITNIYKLYGYDGDLRLSKDLERIIFY